MSDEFGFDDGQHDELRALLADLDPMSARVPVDSPAGPRLRDQLERVMQDPGGSAAGIIATTPQTIRPSRPRGRNWLAAAAAVAAIAVGTTVAVTAGGGDDDKNVVAAPTVLELQGNAGGGLAVGMCLPFEVSRLAQAPVAFGGTVTDIQPELVTIDVDRWFTGGDADVVTVQTPEGMPTAALDGVNWELNQRYLISAWEGIVDGCGYSGPATPEYEKQYEQAFPNS